MNIGFVLGKPQRISDFSHHYFYSLAIWIRRLTFYTLCFICPRSGMIKIIRKVIEVVIMFRSDFDTIDSYYNCLLLISVLSVELFGITSPHVFCTVSRSCAVLTFDCQGSFEISGRHWITERARLIDIWPPLYMQLFSQNIIIVKNKCIYSHSIYWYLFLTCLFTFHDRCMKYIVYLFVLILIGI